MTTALVQAENTAALADTLQSMIEQHSLYIQVCQQLLNDSDYAIIGKTKFRKRTGWAKLRRAFNVGIEVLGEEYINHGDVWGYQFMVRASLPTGRRETGDGACFSDEFGRGNIRATHHNVRAKALTRAKNRATSDILGAGDVSAEELLDDDKPQEQKPGTKPSVAGRAWLENDQRRKAFWAWTHDIGLSHEEVHKALEVDSLKDYQGTPTMAQSQIENWVNEQIELEQAQREAEAMEEPIAGERVPLPM
jgi:hypothetical protein